MCKHHFAVLHSLFGSLFVSMWFFIHHYLTCSFNHKQPRLQPLAPPLACLAHSTLGNPSPQRPVLPWLPSPQPWRQLNTRSPTSNTSRCSCSNCSSRSRNLSRSWPKPPRHLASHLEGLAATPGCSFTAQNSCPQPPRTRHSS